MNIFTKVNKIYNELFYTYSFYGDERSKIKVLEKKINETIELNWKLEEKIRLIKEYLGVVEQTIKRESEDEYCRGDMSETKLVKKVKANKKK